MTNSPLGVAGAIGEDLTRSAVWHDDRCNWVAPISSPDRPGRLLRNLGPSLYDGLAGVGLFLALLAAALDDSELRRTARGALANALGRAAVVPAPGLYDGRIGTALAAAWSAQALAAPDLAADADRLASTTIDGSPWSGPVEHDLIGGMAGAILGLLALAAALERPDLIVQARRLGDRLASAADHWVPAPYEPADGRLAGLAHGASGDVLALAELMAVTGEDRHRAAIALAIGFEQRLLDPAERNWRDRLVGSAQMPSFRVHWCHGAPGIALSRLRVWELTGDDDAREQALLALAATERFTAAGLRAPGIDHSLCHGLAGNAEVLATGEAALGPEAPGGRAMAERVAELGAIRYSHRDRRWPCGVEGQGETPSLMTGLAGIGLFYLRLHDPAIPGVLGVRPS